jgi:hypothetical protein
MQSMQNNHSTNHSAMFVPTHFNSHPELSSIEWNKNVLNLQVVNMYTFAPFVAYFCCMNPSILYAVVAYGLAVLQ